MNPSIVPWRWRRSPKQALLRVLARTFLKLSNRRREEADRARVAGDPPPSHVGGYSLSAFHAHYDISGLALFLPLLLAVPAAFADFRAGAFAVDISPTNFPVRVNAMFPERSATNVTDPLFAKALALDDGATRVVLCVVDTCMIPRD